MIAKNIIKILILIQINKCFETKYNYLITGIAKELLKKNDLGKRIINDLEKLLEDKEDDFNENHDNLISSGSSLSYINKKYDMFSEFFYRNNYYFSNDFKKEKLLNNEEYDLLFVFKNGINQITFNLREKYCSSKNNENQRKKIEKNEKGYFSKLFGKFLIESISLLFTPLNNILYFSNKYEKGDQSRGEDILINHPKYKNIKEIWDNCFDIFDEEISDEINIKDKIKLNNFIKKNIDLNKYYYSEENNIFKVSINSKKIALEQIYQKFNTSKVNDLSEEYIKKSKLICKNQIENAGYKLYTLLVEIYNNLC